MATINGQAITRAEIRIPRLGDWWADVSTDSGTAIPVGARVTIALEGFTLSGAVIRGGILGDVGRYQISGRPEWAKEIAPLAHRSDVAVRLVTVVEQLSKAALGPNYAALIVPPADKSLGTYYEREGTDPARQTTIRARDILEALRLPWYVRADGVTVFADRPTGQIPSSLARIHPRSNIALGLRVVGTDHPEAFVPGLTFEGEVISEVIYRIDKDDYDLDVWSEPGWFAKSMAAIMRRIAPDLWYRGVFAYQVVGPSQPILVDDEPQWWRHDLRPINAKWLPEVKSADLWPGCAGHSASLSAGDTVLLAFVDADASKPVVVGFEPSKGNHGPGKPLVSMHCANTFATRGTTFDSRSHAFDVQTDDASIVATGDAAMDGTTVSLGAATAKVIRTGDVINLVIPGAPPTVFFTGVISFTSTPDPTTPPTKVSA